MAVRATVALHTTVAFCTIAPHSIETAIPVTFMIGEIHVQDLGNVESGPLRCWIFSESKLMKDKIILPDPVSILSEEIAPIMAQMAAIQLSLATRLIAEKSESSQDENDTLLTVEEAAARLKCSEDWLYRRAKSLSFTVRVGRNLRFSERGIEEAIRSGRRFA